MYSFSMIPLFSVRFYNIVSPSFTLSSDSCQQDDNHILNRVSPCAVYYRTRNIILVIASFSPLLKDLSSKFSIQIHKLKGFSEQNKHWANEWHKYERKAYEETSICLHRLHQDTEMYIVC